MGTERSIEQLQRGCRRAVLGHWLLGTAEDRAAGAAGSGQRGLIRPSNLHDGWEEWEIVFTFIGVSYQGTGQPSA